jgi:hypothetical protein
LIVRFAYVGLQRRNVDQRSHLWIGAGNRDDRTAIAVTDEYDRSILLVNDALGCCDIIDETRERLLDPRIASRNFVTRCVMNAVTRAWSVPGSDLHFMSST